MTTTKKKLQGQHPLLLRCQRLMEAFAKSDDERDFFLDSLEGFIVYADLDKSEEELAELQKTFDQEPGRFFPIPKLTFYETKKIMEGFIHEKVFDIDIKEKLMDIIHSKEPRENFLDFLYDQEMEYEKWQQFYQERSRVRIIEWLREHQFQFVFEEDLEFGKSIMEKLKTSFFTPKVGKEVESARKIIFSKAKTYYSSEALNPRPKRGRPPKQTQKAEFEPQIPVDILTSVPPAVRPFVFKPDVTAGSTSFSSKYSSDQEMLDHRKEQNHSETSLVLDNLNKKLATLRKLSTNWVEPQEDTAPEVEVNEEKTKKSTPKKDSPVKKNSTPVKKNPVIVKKSSVEAKKSPVVTKKNSVEVKKKPAMVKKSPVEVKKNSKPSPIKKK